VKNALGYEFSKDDIPTKDEAFHEERGLNWSTDERQNRDQFNFNGKLRGQTIECLSLAIANKDKETLNDFITNASKLHLNDITVFGSTLSSEAAEEGNIGLLNWILINQESIDWDPGCWLSVEPLTGNTLADSALSDESLNSLNWILANQNKINWTKAHWQALVSNEETLAHQAALWGCAKTLDWILAHQNDIEWKRKYWKTTDDAGETFVDRAIAWDNEDVLNWAINHQEDTQLKVKKIGCSFYNKQKSKRSELKRSILRRF